MNTAVRTLCRRALCARPRIAGAAARAFAAAPATAAAPAPPVAAARAAGFAQGVRGLHGTRAAADTVNIIFVDAEGKEKTVDATVGDTLLDVAWEFDIDLEGACGGELACSTCHVILEQALFDAVEEDSPLEEEEEDMLDLALGLTDTSRLGCQIEVTPELEGARVTLPAEVADMRPDEL